MPIVLWLPWCWWFDMHHYSPQFQQLWWWYDCYNVNLWYASNCNIDMIMFFFFNDIIWSCHDMICSWLLDCHDADVYYMIHTWWCGCCDFDQMLCSRGWDWYYVVLYWNDMLMMIWSLWFWSFTMLMVMW